ncbi:hypothetical protein D3C79_1000300 [compost metagenome]
MEVFEQIALHHQHIYLQSNDVQIVTVEYLNNYQQIVPRSLTQLKPHDYCI